MENDNMEWRENIISTLKFIFPQLIPPLVINAIDAAYVAGLDAKSMQHESKSMENSEPSLKEKVNWLINSYLTVESEYNEYITDHDMQDFRNDMVKLVEEVAKPTDCKHEWTYLGKDDSWKYCKNCRTPFKPTSNSLEELLKEFDERFGVLDNSIPDIDNFVFAVKCKDIKSFITKALAKAVAEEREKFIILVEGKRASVEELREKMGEAYTDLSVQVAYKEGYNQALEDILITLKNINE